MGVGTILTRTLRSRVTRYLDIGPCAEPVRFWALDRERDFRLVTVIIASRAALFLSRMTRPFSTMALPNPGVRWRDATCRLTAIWSELETCQRRYGPLRSFG